MPPPSGTVTFLFTDIEGSTRLWESAPEAMRSALERHDAMARAAIGAHDGYVFATGGDGFCVAFGRADEALSAAVDLRGALAEEAWPEGGVIRARMGVHTGEAAERDGDYFGPAVNRAGRLMSIAHGGQVVCSQSTAAVVGDGFPLQSLGEHRLRDLAAAETVFQVGDGAFPPLRSVDVVPTNLPTVRTELIGRSDEVEALAGLVAGERSVTLTGTGGVGKTRLALAVAASVSSDFPDGCWLVKLAAVADGAELPKTVAAAMGAPPTTRDALVEYLSDRQLLIVLDNCEHVIDAASELADGVLAAAADVRILATSREPLGVDGEQVVRVPSLTLPEPAAVADDATSSPAVRLFADRAAAAANGFIVDADNVGAVVDVCRQLDGIPLAIELAAARVRAMAPEEISDRLDERFRLLTGGSRRSLERHRTLGAAVSWSHDLLTDEEKLVFRRLSVFPATFDLHAAEAVAGHDTDHLDVMNALIRLVDRSLVLFDPDRRRYRLLETLRQYGVDRLADAGEVDGVRERHARYFLDFVEDLAPSLQDERFAVAYVDFVAELDNLRAAADCCVDRGMWTELARMPANGWQAVFEAALVDACGWLRAALGHHDELDAQLVIDTLGHLSWLTAMLGDQEEAIELANRSHTLAEELALPVSVWAWNGHSVAAINLGQMSEALEAARNGERAVAARDLPLGSFTALSLQVVPLALLGETERSAAMAEEVLRRAEVLQHPNAISTAISVAAWGAGHSGEGFDPEASLDVLTRHPVAPIGGLNDAWLDIQWGVSLLDRDPPRAIGHLVGAVRTADRYSAAGALHQGLLTLAIAAGEGGLTEQAWMLSAFCAAHLHDQHLIWQMNDWYSERLEGVLRGEPQGDQEPSRIQMMAVVGDVERRLGVGSVLI